VIARGHVAVGAVGDRLLELLVRHRRFGFVGIDRAVAATEIVVGNDHAANWRIGLFGVGATMLVFESKKHAWIRGRSELRSTRSDVDERRGGIDDVRLSNLRPVGRIFCRKPRKGNGQQEEEEGEENSTAFHKLQYDLALI